MKKILLTLGSMAAIAAPVATAVSCGEIPSVIGEKHRAKYILSKEAQVAIRDAGIQALSIPNEDMRFPFGGLEYELGKLRFHWYAKIIFKHNSSFNAGNGVKKVKAQEEILIGANETGDHRAASSTNIRVLYINENNFTEDLTPTLVAKNKMSFFESAMNKALVEIKKSEETQEAREESQLLFSDAVALIDDEKPTSIDATIMKLGYSRLKMLKHLSREHIELLVEKSKTLKGIDKVTELVCYYYVRSLFGGKHLQKFIITFPAGHATDVDLLTSIAATVNPITIEPTPSEEKEAPSENKAIDWLGWLKSAFTDRLF